MVEFNATSRQTPAPLSKKVRDYLCLILLISPLLVPRTLTVYGSAVAPYIKAAILFAFLMAVLFIYRAKLSTTTLILSAALILATMILSIVHGHTMDLQYVSLYTLFFVIFALRQVNLFNSTNAPEFGFALVIFSSLACHIFPESIGNIFAWNTAAQHDYFVSAGKIVGIFGLHSTAGYGYGIVALWFLSRPLNIVGSFCILASIALLLSLRSSSSMVSLILIASYSIYLYSTKKYHLGFTVILFSVGLFCVYWLYSNFSIQSENIFKSLLNRYSESGNFGKYTSDKSVILGFSRSDSDYTFSDSGYLDHYLRFGLFGIVLFYFIFSKFILDNCSNKVFAFFLCTFLLTQEAGHTYSKSVFFSSLWILAVASSGRPIQQIRSA